jgi:hypothetical protein
MPIGELRSELVGNPAKKRLQRAHILTFVFGLPMPINGQELLVVILYQPANLGVQKPASH